MIKCDMGEVIIEGTGTEVLGELSALVNALYEGLTEKAGGDPEKVKDDIRKAVELGLKNKAELDDEVKKALVGFAELLGKAIEKLSDKLNKEDI